MDHTKLSLWRIKPGKRAVWEAWCREVMSEHYAEAAETLREEQLLREWCKIYTDGNTDYLVYLHVPEPGKEKLPATDRALNRKHFEKFTECLEEMTPLGDGYDISAPQ